MFTSAPRKFGIRKMDTGIKHLILGASVLILLVDCSLAVFVNVTSKAGIFIGEKEQMEFGGKFKPVQRFLGIPYAKPPIGNLRFSRPEPPGVIAIPYNATYHRSHCLQTVPLYYKHMDGFVRSEDCLYLNVYVPGDRISETSNFPVMVYIHGGSFALGGADIYAGDKLSAFNDVITVTINYRLNVFGFLSNGTKGAGNFGLWDMKMALEWIQENIRSFGGDSNRVTLFGNSAGGSAVLFMAFYPGNRGLFHRIIAQSGSNLASWAFDREPLKHYMDFLTAHDCNVGDYEKVLTCLRSKPALDLRTESYDYLPAVDYDFILHEPSKLMMPSFAIGKEARDFFSEIDVINGVTDKDGAMSYESWENFLGVESLDAGITGSQFESLVNYIAENDGHKSETLKKAIFYLYTNWSYPDDPTQIRGKLVDYMTDTSFLVPAVRSALAHAKVRNVSSSNYFYVFAHKPGFVPEPLWLRGSTHTMEVAYLFGLHEALERKLVEDLGGIDPFIATEDDIKLSEALMIMWTNFAKSGNPNVPVGQPEVAIPTWPQYDERDQSYLTLEMNMSEHSVQHRLAAERVAFWTELFPVLEKSCAEKSKGDQTSSAGTHRLSSYVVLILFLLSIII